LIALFGGRDRRRAATLFLVFSLAGSAPMFVAIWWIATIPASTGLAASLDFHSLQALLAHADPATRNLLFWAISLAFLVKLPVVPLHLWQADAYSEGPAAGSALLTGVMAKIGLYGFLRIVLPLFPQEFEAHAHVFLGLGLATVLAGALLALRQREARRVLAFSSLSHLGLGLAALAGKPSPEAIAGVTLLMVAHGLSAAALFYLIGTAETWSRSRHLDEFGGLAKTAPLFAVLFALVALASVGLPGTAGFVAEFLLIFSIWKAWGILIGIVAGTTVILSAAYTLRMVQKVLFGEPTSETHVSQDLPAIVPLVVALIVFGFMPGPILKAARPDLLTRLPSAQATVLEDAAHVATGR
jgi:NADH-quinone oxidoreductase subunit M